MVESYFKRPPRSLPPELEDERQRIVEVARRHGLDFFDTIFEMCDYDEINMLAAYGGFPTRYPHWRWGMEFLSMQKGYEYGLQKIYEMVINTNPSYAYLLDNNLFVDQKLVMAHVFGHVDFFKNNAWFAPTNRKMLDEMANHAARVRRIIDEVGETETEQWLDTCLACDNLIDPYLHHIRRTPRDGEPQDSGGSHKLPAKSYMDSYINPPAYLEQRRVEAAEAAAAQSRFPPEPFRDVLGFILEHGRMSRWQRGILDIVRNEAYYFAPQAQTKVANEGWACVVGSTLVFTDRGLLPMRDVVRGEGSVADGETLRPVVGQAVLFDHETVEVWTRRGLRLEGSNNHRIRLADGHTWRRLDELKPGDEVEVAGGKGTWPSEQVALHWKPEDRVGIEEVCRDAGVSVRTLYRHLHGRRVERAAALERALARRAVTIDVSQGSTKRKAIVVPAAVDERLGAFLGYLVGDRHISRVKRNLGLTTGDAPQADAFAELARSLFGLGASLRRDGGRLRVLLHSEMLADFLQDACGLTHGKSARNKSVPEVVLRSPEPVVRAFLRALYDCDGYAGPQGVILSSASDAMTETVQLLLLNYGILSRRRMQRDGCWHLTVLGTEAVKFASLVGFGLERKQEALRAYVEGHRWFKTQAFTDTVMRVRPSRHDVYDITVEHTHRYAAAGFVNHNSFWHTKLMTTELLNDDEVIDYCDHHSGTVAMRPGQFNPYKVGIEIWRDIERRWNRGQFGKDWLDCDDYRAKMEWDTGAMLGKQKIFEVRRSHNDVTLVDEFFTEELCRRVGLFTYEYDRKSGEFLIESREFAEIKKKLLFMLSNHGTPRVFVTDANHGNRGELEITHEHEGTDVQLEWASHAMGCLARMWGRPVHLVTAVEGKKALLHHDGQEFRYEGPKITGKK